MRYKTTTRKLQSNFLFCEELALGSAESRRSRRLAAGPTQKGARPRRCASTPLAVMLSRSVGTRCTHGQSRALGMALAHRHRSPVTLVRSLEQPPVAVGSRLSVKVLARN